MWVFHKVSLKNGDPHSVTQYIGTDMISLLVLVGIGMVGLMFSKEKTLEKLAKLVLTVQAVFWFAPLLVFILSYLVTVLMLNNSPQDAFTEVARYFMGGFSSTILVLGFGTYGIRTLGLYIIKSSIKNDSIVSAWGLMLGILLLFPSFLLF